jgi:hypothetical protein
MRDDLLDSLNKAIEELLGLSQVARGRGNGWAAAQIDAAVEELDNASCTLETKDQADD